MHLLLYYINMFVYLFIFPSNPRVDKMKRPIYLLVEINASRMHLICFVCLDKINRACSFIYFYYPNTETPAIFTKYLLRKVKNLKTFTIFLLTQIFWKAYFSSFRSLNGPDLIYAQRIYMNEKNS